MAAHSRATTEGRPSSGPAGHLPPRGGRLLAEASPIGGKLSPKVTDEGEVSGHYPFTGSNGKVAPHPALRATFPLRGKAVSRGFPHWGKLSPKVTDEGRGCRGRPFTGQRRKVCPHPALRATFPRGGRLLAEASPIGGKLSPKVTDEGRFAVAAHLPGNNGRLPLIRPCGPPHPFWRCAPPPPYRGSLSPRGEGF